MPFSTKTEYCTEKGNGKLVLTNSYIEIPLIRQSKMNKNIALEDGSSRSNDTQSASREELRISMSSMIFND